MTRLDELLHHWRDDSLGSDGLSELASLLESPENRRALVEEFWFAQAATEALGLEQSLSRDAERSATDERAPLRVAAQQERTPLRLWLALAACLVVAVTLGWLALPRAQAVPPVAHVVEIVGEVEVLDPQGNVLTASAGQALFPGQTLRTGEDGYAAIEYPDATRLELHADTIVRLAESARVVFSSGMVRADVSPRHDKKTLVLSSPQVEVRASESRILLASSTPESTRVDLESGNAELVRQTDGRVVEMESGSYTVATMDLDPPVVQPLPGAQAKPLRSIEFRPARAAAYAAGGDLRLAWPRMLRSLDKGQVKQHPLLARKGEGQTAFARQGNTLAVSIGAHVAIWDIDPFRARKQWNTPLHINNLAISDDGNRLATLDVKKAAVSVFDAQTGVETHRLSAGVRMSRGLDLSADGTIVAVAFLPRVRGAWHIQLLNATTGKPAGQIGGQEAPARLIAFSPDSRTLATAANDGVVRLFDVTTRTLVHRITSHGRQLTSLAFSPDGTHLAGGSGDGQVWLWHAETGQQVRQIKAGQRAVLALAFSPDGTRLITGGQAMPVQEWDVSQP